MTLPEPIQSGDRVALYSSRNGVPELRHVERVTATQVILWSPGNGSAWRFRRDTGMEIGGDRYFCARIGPVTDGVREVMARHAALTNLREMRWNNYNTQTLLDTLALLRERRGESATAADAVAAPMASATPVHAREKDNQ